MQTLSRSFSKLILSSKLKRLESAKNQIVSADFVDKKIIQWHHGKFFR